MGNKKNRQREAGYKPVETQNNESIKESVIQNPMYNPFNVVGDAKPSKSFKSLAMRIRHESGEIHHYTILKSELERMFLHNPEQGELIPAEIREYLNP